MAIQITERVTRQLVIDVGELDEEQQARLTKGVEELLRRVLHPENEREEAGWTASALDEALHRLDEDGAWVQAAVIRKALETGGHVTRDRVFKIGHYPKGRSLRGFTKPVSRIVGEMRYEGLVPEEAAELLVSSYQDGVKADGFKIPPMLAALYS